MGIFRIAQGGTAVEKCVHGDSNQVGRRRKVVAEDAGATSFVVRLHILAGTGLSASLLTMLREVGHLFVQFIASLKAS